MHACRRPFSGSPLAARRSALYDVAMAQRLLNKVAVVTGATGSLGRAIVQGFLAEGARVVVFGRNRGRLDELAGLATARVLVVEGDVTNSGDLESLVATTIRRFGGVDVLVPAAGILQPATLVEATPEFVAPMFAVNWHGALETVRLFERHLNAGASVVFLTTPAAGVARAGFGPFSASKAALSSLARTLAVELSPRGIRVNCVAPVQTDALSRDTSAKLEGDTKGNAAVPSRLDSATSEQVADAVLFLASNDAAGITGQELIVKAKAV
jgi:NAD(P)-dependent dehydrogenase (short-subunit alcohol dehydrogenase family)